MAVLHHLEEVEHLLLVQRADAEVIDDEEVGVGHASEEPGERALDACHGDLLEEFQNVVVAHLEAKHAGLVPQCGGKPAFPRSRRPCDEDGDSPPDVGAGGQFHDPALVQPSACVKPGLHDGGLVAEAGLLQQSRVAVLLPLFALGLQEELQPVAQAHAVHAPGLDERLPALFHAGQSQPF